jgi:hypothetical protein
MSRTRRQRTRHALAAITLAAPTVVFASPSPTTAQKQEAPETRPMIETASAHEPGNPLKGALLRAVVESLSQQRGQAQEASPFEPPGKPSGRPPDNPGHHDPPNPPGQPPDRPPVRPDH